MKQRAQLIVVVTFIAFLITACVTTPGGGGVINYSGSWVGSIQDSVAGSGTVSATLTQSGTSIVGTWQAVFAAGTNGGSLSGVVNGSQVILELFPSSVTACPFRVVATGSATSMSGNYAAFNCTGSITGTISMTKQ